MTEQTKQARNLKIGDSIHYFNGDLLNPDKQLPRNYPLSGTIQGIDAKGYNGIAFKTINGWTRKFARMKKFTVEVRGEDRYGIPPVTPLKTPERVKGLSIE